jgi:DNA-binding GntR family transcriptional regulator
VQAIIDHDADSAEYLMKKHIQGGYETVQREFASRAPKPREPRRTSAGRAKT